MHNRSFKTVLQAVCVVTLYRCRRCARTRPIATRLSDVFLPRAHELIEHTSRLRDPPRLHPTFSQRHLSSIMIQQP